MALVGPLFSFADERGSMKLISGHSNRFVLASLALLLAGVAGCHDAESTAPKTVPTPSGPMRDLGTVLVHVDMKHHRITTEPLSSNVATAPGVSARFFGTPTQIEYALAEQNFTDLGSGNIEYNIHAGFANLLTFAIGTNSPHTYPSFPQDTMGVYVYFALLPGNITNLGGPCVSPACTVTVDSADGFYPFTSGTPQPYVFWKSILEGGGTNAQVPGPFETDQHTLPGGINYYRRMSFRTHGNVTNFDFGIAMAAAWVDPNENRWKVSYLGDSIPTRTSLDVLHSDPDWRRLGTTGAVSITPAACAPVTGACNLTLVGTAGDTLIFYRSDSLRASQNGYIAATLSLSTLTGAEPGVFLGLKDPTKLAQLGISTSLTGFTDSTGTLLPLYSFPTVLGRTSYRVTKYGTDSASIFSPACCGVALMTIPYSALPPAPVRGSGPPNYDRFFFFGNITASVTSTAATSLWTTVNYEIGAAAP